MSTSHFADEPSQLPLDYLRGLMSVSKAVSVDEQYRGECSGGCDETRSVKWTSGTTESVLSRFRAWKVHMAD